MGTLFLTLATISFSIGTYIFGYSTGWDRGFESNKEIEEEFNSFWEEVKKGGIR